MFLTDGLGKHFRQWLEEQISHQPKAAEKAAPNPRMYDIIMGWGCVLHY